MNKNEKQKYQGHQQVVYQQVVYEQYQFWNEILILKTNFALLETEIVRKQ